MRHRPVRRVLRTVPMAAAFLAVPVAAWGFQARMGRVEGSVRLGSRPAARAVVFLEGAEPRGSDPPEPEAVVDQVDLRFVPEMIVVLPGTTVVFPNSDPILHNVFSPGGAGPGFDLGTYPPGEARSRRFDEPGIHVILCHVHPEMVAYVAVVPTPYRAVVDAGGAFAIEAVPPGPYTLHVWQVRRPDVGQEVVVPEGGVARVDLRIPR